MRKKLSVALFFILVVSLFFGNTVIARFAGEMGRRGSDFVPAPVLLEPARDEESLVGKDTLTFRWSSHESSRGIREYYDFRLYKGYQMLEGTLINKQKVDPQTYEVSMPASLFEEGQVYTWSLRQVYDGTHKSDRAQQSFKVIKTAPQPQK